jgi:outer membrane protein assembly factor BamB
MAGTLGAGDALPGAGLAQHPFLYCGEGKAAGASSPALYVVRDGRVAWTYPIGEKEELGDCTMLSNGNIVFSRRLGASEVTPDKRIVWNYDAPPGTEIHVAYPVDKDHVLIVQNGNPAQLKVIDMLTGKDDMEMDLDSAHPDAPHGQFRRARMTSRGTFLVAHMDLGKVVEYSEDGRKIWSVDAPGAWSAVRLKNGNTLIGGNRYGYVREVDAQGKTVWEIKKDDLPGIELYTVQEVSRLENGNTLINNWNGSAPEAEKLNVPQLIEVTPDKKVVWALRDYQALGPATATQLLDEKGAPERRELQR